MATTKQQSNWVALPVDAGNVTNRFANSAVGCPESSNTWDICLWHLLLEGKQVKGHRQGIWQNRQENYKKKKHNRGTTRKNNVRRRKGDSKISEF